MERLIHARLFGEGLVPVPTPELVQRYNRALERLGIEPTDLKSFQTDGIGWSPEIADEREDPMYLSHGVSNQLGIILTPDQEGKPIYFPFRSFDRRLMRMYFDRFRPEIVDITASASIQIEIDQGMTSYTTPRDLLLIDYFVVRSSSGRLLQRAIEQQQLVQRFREEPDAWLDDSLRHRLIESATEFGDLRSRRVHVPEMRFDDVRDFYTRAFGGVFVLRSGPGKDILVTEDPEVYRRTNQSAIAVFSQEGTAALDHLYAQGFIEIDIEWYRLHLDRLEYIYDCLVENFLCEDDGDLDVTALTQHQLKRRLVERRGVAPDAIFELERLLNVLRSGAKVDVQSISTGLQKVLLHPTDRLSAESRKVVWQLLCGHQPWNVHRIYIFCRNRFYDLYETWPESKRNWSIALIRDRYRLGMQES